MIIRQPSETTRALPAVFLSQTAVYALNAMLFLARPEVDGPVRVDDLATHLGVPRNYLSKILHVLARNRVLESTRGPGGGFTLRMPPEEVTLASVIRHFDALPEGRSCLLGKDVCSDADPCPAHARWKVVSESALAFFSTTTIADLSREGATVPTFGSE